MLDTLRADAGTSACSTFLEALERNEWHADAACAGQDDVFLSDLSLGQDRQMPSPKVLLAFLTCAGCPVRGECLAESLRRVRVRLGEGVATEAAAAGVWGGSTEWDRRGVRHLPPDEAAAELERTFPERLARRVAAFHAAYSNGHRPPRYFQEVRRMLVGPKARWRLTSDKQE